MNTRTRTTARHAFAATALAALSLVGAAEVRAEEWKWTVTPYAWATDIGVDVAIDDRQVVDEEIPVEDLLEDVDTLAQVRLEAQRGRHGLMVDLFDVNMSDSTGADLPSGAGSVLLASEIGMTILDVAALYDPKGDRQGFSFLYGTRILDQRAEIGARFRFDDGSSRDGDYELADTLVDGLVGVRFARSLSPRWGYQMQADVSAGGTDLTWSVGPSLLYSFGQDGRYALTAGYRRMAIDFDTGSKVDAEMTLDGFLAGLRVRF